MTLKKPLFIALIAFAPALSISAYAAEVEKSGTEAQTEKAPVKKVQPHSHMQEKTGVAPSVESASPDSKSRGAAAPLKADKDRTKHFHPRDGK